MWKCKICGNIKPIPFDTIKGTKNKKGCICGRCSGYEKQTVEIIQARIDLSPEQYHDLKLLRKGKKRNFVWFCKHCQKEWEASWVNIKLGTRCWDCNQNGQYTIKNAELNADLWKQASARVYIIKCWNEKENFFKIGITSNNVKQRFHAKQDMPYNYEIIYEIKSNKYHSTYLEHHLHSKHKGFNKKPTIKFDGYTECFSQLDEKVVEEFLLKDVNLNFIVDRYNNEKDLLTLD